MFILTKELRNDNFFPQVSPRKAFIVFKRRRKMKAERKNKPLLNVIWNCTRHLKFRCSTYWHNVGMGTRMKALAWKFSIWPCCRLFFALGWLLCSVWRCKKLLCSHYIIMPMLGNFFLLTFNIPHFRLMPFGRQKFVSGHECARHTSHDKNIRHKKLKFFLGFMRKTLRKMKTVMKCWTSAQKLSILSQRIFQWHDTIFFTSTHPQLLWWFSCVITKLIFHLFSHDAKRKIQQNFWQLFLAHLWKLFRLHKFSSSFASTTPSLATVYVNVLI